MIPNSTSARVYKEILPMPYCASWTDHAYSAPLIIQHLLPDLRGWGKASRRRRVPDEPEEHPSCQFEDSSILWALSRSDYRLSH